MVCKGISMSGRRPKKTPLGPDQLALGAADIVARKDRLSGNRPVATRRQAERATQSRSRAQKLQTLPPERATDKQTLRRSAMGGKRTLSPERKARMSRGTRRSAARLLVGQFVSNLPALAEQPHPVAATFFEDVDPRECAADVLAVKGPDGGVHPFNDGRRPEHSYGEWSKVGRRDDQLFGPDRPQHLRLRCPRVSPGRVGEAEVFGHDCRDALDGRRILRDLHSGEVVLDLCQLIFVSPS